MQSGRFHVTTFGCQMNAHDSERMEGLLESLGYGATDSREDADLILFNTCSIRETADERFVTHLMAARSVKRRRPETIIGVGGCWAQSTGHEIFERFPFVDVAFGPGQVGKLAEFLTSDSITAQGYFEFESFTADLPLKRDQGHQAWVQISVGCNCRCSYCIVPSTRGREASRPLEAIVDEVARLADAGVREVTLLGQNVNAWGRDLRPDPQSFSGLLAAVDAVDGVARVRYTSPHPKDMREDVIDAHIRLASVCEHIHLPLQSGSSSVLKRMRRTYDRDRYLDRVAMIRERLPDCAITTDIIVGFPGESDEDFQETVDIVESVGFDGAFTFVFSPRRGTEAAGMTDLFVKPEVVRERMDVLLEAVRRRAGERAERFQGREIEVMIEGQSRNDPSKLRGRSRHNRNVYFEGVGNPGELVPVMITGTTSQSLSGEMSLAAAAAQRFER